MSSIVKGRRSWGGSRNDKGHREYRLTTLIIADPLDGPATILNTPGLPLPGSHWAFGADYDLWAFCKLDATVKIHQEKDGDPNRYWIVEQTFTTDPGDMETCVDAEISDPILEPAKVSGGFTKYTMEAVVDRYGRQITNSAFEQIKGAANEWDANRMTIRIEQNVATIFQAAVLPSILMDHVNGGPIWGLPARTVKLSGSSWEKKYHGQCFAYYSRTLEFDIKYDTFDRILPDQGTLALHGHWGKLDGAGCTINPAMVGGVVISATLISGGTGYAKNAVIDLTVLDGVGTGCIVTVQTDKDGVIVAVLGVLNGGFNYSGFPASTVVKTGWILDLINGRSPNRFNPGHFDRYKDRKDHAANVQLDGRGKPYEGFIQQITTCAQCPGSPGPFVGDPAQGGTSRVWRVTGNTGAFVQLNTLLLYQSGCSWSGVGLSIIAGGAPRYTATLSHLGGALDTWKLKQKDNLTGIEEEWFHSPTEDGPWDCNGPNMLHKIGAFGETLTVSPATEEADAPGAIFVSVYDNANFFLLGVPVQF